jgi:uncharacterized membrane protein
MKMGPFDGSMEEVKDLFENNGLKLEDYLEKPPSHLATKFMIIPAVVLGIALLLLAIFTTKCSHAILTLLYLLGFSGGTWLTVSIQLRYKNTLATFAVAIGSLLMILVASGIFSPKEAVEFIKEIKK